MVRCNVRAMDGFTSTYLLQGGKSSNARRDFDNVVRSSGMSETQSRLHADVVVFQSKRDGGKTARRSETAGPLDGYLAASWP